MVRETRVFCEDCDVTETILPATPLTRWLENELQNTAWEEAELFEEMFWELSVREVFPTSLPVTISKDLNPSDADQLDNLDLDNEENDMIAHQYAQLHDTIINIENTKQNKRPAKPLSKPAQPNRHLAGADWINYDWTKREQTVTASKKKTRKLAQ